MAFLSACVREDTPPTNPPAASDPEGEFFAPEPPEEAFSLPEEESSTIDPLEEEARLSVAPEPESLAESAGADFPASAPAEPPRSAAAQSAENVTQAQPERGPAAVAAPDIRTAALDEARIEEELLRLVNEARLAEGVESLGMEDRMRFAARIRAMELAQEFSHTRPDGTAYYTAFDEAGFDYAGKWHGENIASMVFQDDHDEEQIAGSIFSLLKESPGQYQNMVGENFLQTGIGVFILYNEPGIQVDTVQLFSSL